MADATYNGWPNRAAWNVALWIGNDEGLYRTSCDFARTHKRREQTITANMARAFCADLFWKGETPDGDKLADVTNEGWADIATMFEELVSE